MHSIAHDHYQNVSETSGHKMRHALTPSLSDFNTETVSQATIQAMAPSSR